MATKNSSGIAEEDILDAATDPFTGIMELAEQTGMDKNVVQRMVERMRAQHQPIVSELKSVRTQDLLEVMEDRMWRALQYMDDYAMSRATVKDLAIAFGILGDKRQLLKGEPTHIISRTERANLNELAPMLLQELQNRGIEYHADAEYVEVGPPQPKRRSPGRKGAERNKIKKALVKQELGEK